MDVTLVERVDELVRAPERTPVDDPDTVAIGLLAERIEALERVVRELALEIERVSSAEPLRARRSPCATVSAHRDLRRPGARDTQNPEAL